MTYRFLSPARRDVAAAVEHYEGAAAGLGLRFVDELEKTLHRILAQPRAWMLLSGRLRRCRMRRFPYGVIYSIEGEIVLIAAVFHLHRRPEDWEKWRS